MGGTVGMILLALAVAAIAGISLTFNPRLSLALADGLLFAVPAMFFGRIKAFVPRELSLKMPCFQAIFGEKIPEHIAVTPYLRFDKDKDGRDVPEDIRLMIEPRRKPEDFVGVQMQAALNKGPNGEVPYLYAVMLTKGRGETYRRLKNLSADGYEIEPGGDEEYGSIVVRQETSGTGYATKPSDCVRLYDLVCSILESKF
jgi:hypothetical protein